MLAAVAAAAVFGLPVLPSHGLAVQNSRGVMLAPLRGRPFAELTDYALAIPRGTHGLLLEKGKRFFVLDPAARLVREVARSSTRVRGCRDVDQTTREQLLLCGREIELLHHGRSRVVAGAPDRHGGSWAWADFAPNGRDVLAEWSGECEIPTAFLIRSGTVKPYGASTYAHAPESEPLGWLPDGRAVVQFGSGACGSGIAKPGVYAIPRRGRPQLLRATGTKPVLISMWGG